MEGYTNITGDGKLKKRIITAGTGACPKKGQIVNVSYIGKFENGKIFDQSDESDPFQFTLGEGEVIKGWDLGVATMKKGETCELHITSDYGYGDRGVGGVIPGKATLVFQVTLF